MPKRTKYPAEVTALLLILNAELFGAEKSREVSRFRISRTVLRRVSGWARLSEPFLSDIAENMAAYGWRFIEHSDTEFAAIQTAKMSTWPKLGHKRLIEKGLLGSSESDIYNAYDRDHPGDETVDDEVE
ncbi:hypothetical protein ACKI2N_032725 [Cupriavidus sp. 30B13]|uniref:hypothetical protein n=1 Tax=Cupriavidus sp. 30B13 TaxID=3384241 RepID=UPI003B921DA9